MKEGRRARRGQARYQPKVDKIGGELSETGLFLGKQFQVNINKDSEMTDSEIVPIIQ